MLTNIGIKQLSIINSSMLIILANECFKEEQNDYFRSSVILTDFTGKLLILYY